MVVALLSAFAILFIVRLIWIFKNLRGFIHVMSAYVKINKLNYDEMHKLCRLTRLTELFFDMTHWEFFKYIKDKEAYHNVCLFHVNLMMKILKGEDDTKPATKTDSK